MKKRKFIQYSITVGALLIATAHLIWPSLSIDGVVAILIIIALVPWLSPLFKSLELPGGLKFEFQELEKVGQEARAAGLIKEGTTQSEQDEYSFLSVAEFNPNLALTGLRIEIEKSLRKLAAENNINPSRKGLRALMNELSKGQLLTSRERSTLEDMITALNEAAHGERFDPRVANWVIEIGPKILASLDGKIQKRVVARDSSSPHNMDTWGHEKSEKALLSLARLVDTIKAEYVDNPELQDKFFEQLSPAIWNTSKLYSFFNDTEWQTEDRDIIMREGIQGFEKLKHRYNRA
ncbi:MAG: hypothetical protein FD156_1897 [Nitrospirae bacterium]|nr:MAG: hypothetical protein FD156_1897 [Nitrospirota bacterium]